MDTVAAPSSSETRATPVWARFTVRARSHNRQNSRRRFGLSCSVILNSPTLPVVRCSLLRPVTLVDLFRQLTTDNGPRTIAHSLNATAGEILSARASGNALPSSATVTASDTTAGKSTQWLLDGTPNTDKASRLASQLPAK